MNSFLSPAELLDMGFASCAPDARISRFASFYGREHIRIGPRCRIDDFAIVSAAKKGDGVTLVGDNHISAGAYLYGRAGIWLAAYAHVAPRAIVMSESEDYSSALHPVPVESAQIVLKYASVIGAGAFVFPGVTLHEGAVLAVNSCAKGDIDAWQIWGGNPAKFLKRRC